jgi:hypothetical protein
MRCLRLTECRVGSIQFEAIERFKRVLISNPIVDERVVFQESKEDLTSNIRLVRSYRKRLSL